MTPTINPFFPDTGTTGDGTKNSGTVTLTGRADAGGANSVSAFPNINNRRV